MATTRTVTFDRIGGEHAVDPLEVPTDDPSVLTDAVYSLSALLLGHETITVELHQGMGHPTHGLILAGDGLVEGRFKVRPSFASA